MNPLTLEQIRNATNAKLIASDSSLAIHSICTDTRNITPGCLFIALKGENHDGHDHIQSAAHSGAVAVMVDRPVITNLPLIQVENTRRAMGRLANHVRRQLKCTVIAVAGSNGKTGTKNLIHAALKNSRTGTLSPKSFNNDIGVPTTIFAASPTDDYLILEIGTNHPGEILNLTKIAEPDIAIITNIGAEHLEFLGDLDGVTKENAQIIAALNPRGLLILNGDGGNKGDTPAFALENKGDTPPFSRAVNGASPLYLAVEGYAGHKVTFGFEPTNDLYPSDIRCESDGVYFHLKSRKSGPGNSSARLSTPPKKIHHGGTEGTENAEETEPPMHTDSHRSDRMPEPMWNDPCASVCIGGSISAPYALEPASPEIFIPLMGRHTAVNALAAIAVARHLGVDDAAIFAGLATAVGPEMRLQLQTAGLVKILNDAYNANPHSMRAALETLGDMESDGRKIAILGDMREVGPTADRYHREIGSFAAECGLDQLVCVGEKARLIAEAAIDAGMEADCVERFPTAAQCAANISSVIAEGDLVLLKASRGMKLESIAAAITSLVAGMGLRREVALRTARVIKGSAKVVSQSAAE